MLSGKHLIAGTWTSGQSTFQSSPASGLAHDFSVGTTDLVDEAANAAERAFQSYSQTTRSERAELLNRIADEIDMRGEAITEIGCQETGLPKARLIGEKGRTVEQLRMFAIHIEGGLHLDRRHDPALPDRRPLPRPELRMVQRPIGPVAVFGASNFPLAFSVAGGDTASALAAGCPVVVKGHSAHPGTSEIVARAIDAAITAQGIDPGVFSLIQGGRRDVGEALVKHPLIKAVGFTGSTAGGRALFDLCVGRPEPIPFFGELGSINPVFVLPTALASRGAEIARGWAASLTLGAGQFCTNPGVVFLLGMQETDVFIAAAVEALRTTDTQPMLTDGIATAFREGSRHIENLADLRKHLGEPREARAASPYLFETSLPTWTTEPSLAHEVFGPLGVVVRVPELEDLPAVAAAMEGQLTCTLQLDEADYAVAAKLMTILERKAGRVLANGFPTGVEVCDTMVHGGPYPASTNFGATSVGTLAIRRFLRPVCYQNIPEELLPRDLVD